MSALSDKQFFIVGGALVGGFLLLTLLGRKAVGAAVDTGAGIVTGNNAITKGTPYEGTGVLGTLGSAVNEASGGVFQHMGEKIGGWAFDVFGPDHDETKLRELRSEGISG